MHLYRTQNIYFDECFDNIKAKSVDHCLQQASQYISEGNASQAIATTKSQTIYDALLEEQETHGVSIVNNVLIGNANIDILSSRKTIFMRLNNPVVVDLGQGMQIINFVAVTAAPARLGALNLRYLSRLTRLMNDKALIESLRAVEGVDGLKLMLNDVSPNDQVSAA